jgi:hypothetical protein
VIKYGWFGNPFGIFGPIYRSWLNVTPEYKTGATMELWIWIKSWEFKMAIRAVFRNLDGLNNENPKNGQYFYIPLNKEFREQTLQFLYPPHR